MSGGKKLADDKNFCKNAFHFITYVSKFDEIPIITSTLKTLKNE